MVQLKFVVLSGLIFARTYLYSYLYCLVAFFQWFMGDGVNGNYGGHVQQHAEEVTTQEVELVRTQLHNTAAQNVLASRQKSEIATGNHVISVCAAY